jgi:hypothetical protein
MLIYKKQFSGEVKGIEMSIFEIFNYLVENNKKS